MDVRRVVCCVIAGCTDPDAGQPSVAVMVVVVEEIVGRRR